jgi:CDP-diglyceride synthetase
VTAWILVGLMFALAALAVLDAVAILRAPRAGRRGSAGLRLALSLLVLLTPAWLLVQSHRELASLLVPFGFVALSAATESAARTERSLRRTAALLQFLIAAHLFVTLRYTIFENQPAVRDMGAFGTATLAIAVLAALLALLRCLALRSYRPPAPAPERAATAPS